MIYFWDIKKKAWGSNEAWKKAKKVLDCFEIE